VTPAQERELAKEQLKRAQAQLEAAVERMTTFQELFRDERDEAVRKAAEVKVPKTEIAAIVHSTPQWVNKILRGEAYKRRTDHQ
jgi:hypothetical protein